MIRVGLVLDASWIGGVNYYRNLLQAVATLPDRRIEPILFTGSSVADDVLANFPATEVVRSRWLNRRSPGWFARRAWQLGLARDPLLERLLRAKGIDVLSHSGVLGRGSAIGTASWIVDFQHRELPQNFTGRERLYRDRGFRLQCDHATRIILSSEDAKSALASFRPCCVDKARVLRFVAQPELGRTPIPLALLRERYGFAEPYLLVPNQFWAHKNHGLILDALALLKVDGRCPLVISTGMTKDYRQPHYFDALIARAEHLGVLDSFRVLGVIPPDDLVGLMAHAVALINPSRSEGWSTSVEEAKSLGKRVILSEIPVHREQAPRDGIYIDPDSPAELAAAMESALGTYDPEIERERAERAKFALSTRVRDYAAVYQDIIIEASASRAS